MLAGEDGNDVLRGGAGNDVLLDYSGNNTFYLDAGSDFAAGGTGKDTFIVTADHVIGDDVDIIVGFTYGLDKINLSATAVESFSDLQVNLYHSASASETVLSYEGDVFLRLYDTFLHDNTLSASDFVF
jgi:Ca2+-binding RTX toxin-like protein